MDEKTMNKVFAEIGFMISTLETSKGHLLDSRITISELFEGLPSDHPLQDGVKQLKEALHRMDEYIVDGEERIEAAKKIITENRAQPQQNDV